MKSICKFILINILGWKVEDSFPSEIKKCIIIVAPHTSWIDFPITVLTNFGVGINANYLGKASLFKPPFGFIFKSLGGVPVDRSKSNNYVNTIVSIFNSKEQFRLGLSPEGTRKKVDTWKTGFYYIAKGANVPILSVALDYEHKIIKLSPTVFYPTDDKDADFIKLQSFFKDIKGKVPEYS